MGVLVRVGVDVGLAVVVNTEVRVGVLMGVERAVAIGVSVEEGVGVSVSIAGVCVGLAQDVNMTTEDTINDIDQNGLRITIPPHNLGISQIIHLLNTIALL